MDLDQNVSAPVAGTPAHHCRNCGSETTGAYCPACGQETRTRLPTFAQFMRDAAGRYVALDGKWWRTLGALVFRPGFLTRQYLAGRRRRYVRPSRLFLVASLLVFAVLRLEVEFGGFDLVEFDEASKPASSARNPAVTNGSAAGATAGKGLQLPAPGGGTAAVQLDEKLDIRLGGAEESIPGLKQRIAHFNELSSKERIAQMTDGTLRYGPYAMFALLPAFAALLKVLYLGSGRRRPHRPRLYGEHLVFAAHNSAFLAFIVAAAVAAPYPWARTILLTWPLVYLLWSLRVIYGGTWIGTILRAFVMFVAYAVLFSLAVAGLVVASVLVR